MKTKKPAARQFDASERFFSDGGGFRRLGLAIDRMVIVRTGRPGAVLIASLIDYRGGYLTLRRRDDEHSYDFRQRRLFALAYLETAEHARRTGYADEELTALSHVASAVRGDSPWP